MNQITTRYVTENGACYEQYVITDAEAKTELVITPERGGMITGFSLNGEEYIWTRHPNFSECNRPRFGVPDISRVIGRRGILRAVKSYRTFCRCRCFSGGRIICAYNQEPLLAARSGKFGKGRLDLFQIFIIVQMLCFYI